METKPVSMSAADAEAPPYARDAGEVVAALGSDAGFGLTGAEAEVRLSGYGPNEISKEKPPSVWAVALQQLRDPMNIMLVVVTVVSLVIGEVSTGVIVALLILLNVVLGSIQELKARASIDALSSLQVPQAKVVRDGSVALVPAVELVPGDIVEVEAGDIVPADGRIVHSATLETQEAALTGESAPIPKDAGVLTGPEVALGDRSNMLFQNTAVTRGTAAMVVTATGMQTEMGKIATMLTSVTRTRSPLQKELGKLTYVLGIIAWGAVAFIVVVGVARGEKFSDVLLLGTAMAISAIPTGMPAFVSGLLSMGAKQLADAKAVVKNLTDVETLGATSAINTDKTGTLTLNQMMVSTLYTGDAWFTVEGEGYRKTGALTSVAGAPVPDFTRIALGLVLDSDATVRDDGSVVGDPTEAALVVLAAKLGVDAEETRRAYPRIAEVPFDSDYKFMATFHRVFGGRDGARDPARQGRPRRRAGPLHALRRTDDRLAGADRGGAFGHRRRERAHGREGPARARVRRALRRGGRARSDDRRPDVAHAGPRVRGHGRDHRPAAAVVEGRRPDRARRRHRRAHDHRRPRRHREGDRRDARARAGSDQRQPSCRR